MWLSSIKSDTEEICKNVSDTILFTKIVSLGKQLFPLKMLLILTCNEFIMVNFKMNSHLNIFVFISNTLNIDSYNHHKWKIFGILNSF